MRGGFEPPTIDLWVRGSTKLNYLIGDLTNATLFSRRRWVWDGASRFVCGCYLLATPTFFLSSKKESASFKARTTRVSNPVRSPRFRTSVSVPVQIAAFATGVLSNIYEFHLYTGNSAILSRTLAKQYQWQFLGWAQAFHHWLSSPPTCSLRPVIPNNASSLRITAAAGTELAGASSTATVIIFTVERVLQP